MKYRLIALVACLVGCGTTTPKTETPPPSSALPPVIEPSEQTPGDEGLALVEPRINASDEAERLTQEGISSIEAFAFEEGVRKLKESLVFSADQPEVRQTLVGVYLRLGRVVDALNVTEEWLRAQPNDGVAVQFRTLVLMRAGRLRDARDVVQGYLQNQPNNLAIRNLLARVFVMMGFHEKAIRESTTVLKADQVNVEAMTNVARTYLAQQKADLAQFVIVQALQVSETATLYHLLSQVYIRLENWQQAEAYLRKATELDGDFPEALNNLGVVYQRVGDYPSAVDSLEQAVRVAPGYREAYLNLGNAYRGLKEYTKAQGAYEKALTVDDRYADAYFNLGILFFENEIEGMDETRRLQLVVENFNKYKRVIGSMIPKNDPADQYIEEATRLIKELRQQKENEMKQPSSDDEFGSEEEDGESEDVDEESEEPQAEPVEPPVEPVEPPAEPVEPEEEPPVEPVEPEDEPQPRVPPEPEPAPEPLPEPESPDEVPEPDDIPVPDEG
jgi:tetratricopeptide (TPR) repeat protein